MDLYLYLTYLIAMKYSDLKKTLKKHALRITDCRMDVLEIFQNTTHALSFKYLENELREYDRVTLYRTLYSFIDKGMLHRIPNDSGATIYGLCSDDCTAEEHKHDHIHFKCEKCGSVECLPAFHVPKMSIPGYKIHSSDHIINGFCALCDV